MKRLVNIKNNDSKCFLWCHIRHLNPLKIHPQKIVSNLDYSDIKCPVSKKITATLNKRIIFALMYFVMEMIRCILFKYQIKNLRNVWIYC